MFTNFQINMILLYIISVWSLGLLFVDSSEPIQIEQRQEIVDNNGKNPAKSTKVSNSDQINLWKTGTENSEILENLSDEEYEEIIFQDNFDKEYREDVGDGYFWEPENTEE